MFILQIQVAGPLSFEFIDFKELSVRRGCHTNISSGRVAQQLTVWGQINHERDGRWSGFAKSKK